MENQINIGNQNTQQIEQNPISQPVISPKKPKVKYWMILVSICSFILLVVLGFFIYIKFLDKQSLQEKTNKKSITNQITNTESLTSAPNLVYFTRSLETTYDKFSLWKLDPYTKATNKIIDVESADYGCNQNFQVDPNGAFAIFCKNFNLYKFTFETSELKQITQIGNGGDDKFFGVSVSPAAISSDGKLLAYEVSSQEVGIFGPEEKRVGNPNIKFGLYVLNLVTGETNGPLIIYKAAISEASGWIYFTKSSDKLIVNNAGDIIKIVNLQDSSSTLWTVLNYSNYISFSLNSNCSVIESYEPFKQGVTRKIYITDGDLQKLEQIYETTEFMRFIIPSSDCRKLVFDGGNLDINILDTTSKQKQLLMNEDERANGGTIKGWLSDDKTIIYVNHDSGDIFGLNTETKDNQQFTNFGDISRNTVKVY
ncbi:hypothetical protein COW99_03580 [Candidatus Roizmanbacteria bacterium CG22_combo_CG10-13_8_21_14_all_38_20]|uniref:Uncharacterized protein n=1 Tax=Candidatus Roizmanbacteria bacterium CG22_combo_CG10-13_8_21_14_all_38_20 TaxID=1974862 RepID=A0A2H0BVL2_9BACT|nr:hypothetical protein [Candidatus Microgenomates bacterium]PIP61579.1 MAG: hypothetical protein COW99_03580 [Candidatus Roizmanbacteria bacterium CG22_combo_CG10-13_8_21_14_all_38_20]PJC31533.1 MAG: hypothetical protein CO050_03045 [Candidatus Roizmanbacteria bacterium CG_4_9_14_0_2_um_filter_38_17]